MSQKNHIARIMTVMLVVSVMVSMAGVVSAFEIKINTIQHSSPVNGGTLTMNSLPLTIIPVTPAITSTIPVTPAPTPTQIPATLETVNSPDEGNAVTSSETGQEEFWSFINSLFDISPDEQSTDVVPTTIGSIDASNHADPACEPSSI